jgi:hypothetical protein
MLMIIIELNLKDYIFTVDYPYNNQDKPVSNGASKPLDTSVLKKNGDSDGTISSCGDGIQEDLRALNEQLASDEKALEEAKQRKVSG